tara:strand:- start:40 stop:1509 length:1470 start_codon:yes stop_codon:yes gene_type:complete
MAEEGIIDLKTFNDKILEVKPKDLPEVMDAIRSQILANKDAGRPLREFVPPLIHSGDEYFGIATVTDFTRRHEKWVKGGRKGAEPNLHKRASKGQLTSNIKKYNTREYRSTRLKGPGLRQARALDPLYNEAGELIRESRWPEGKSVKGFYSEMAKHWRAADKPVQALEELLGIKVNRGHGVSAMGNDPTSIYPWGGSNWFDNVAPEAAIPNIRHGKRNTNPAGLLYELGQEGGSVDQAFQAYLAGDDAAFNQWGKYSHKELTSILHSPDPEATIAKLDREALFKAVNPEATGMPDYRAKFPRRPQIPLAIERAGKVVWANTQEILNSWKLNSLVQEASKVGKGVKLPGYVLPGIIGTTLSGIDLSQKRADAQENPTLANQVQLGLASVNTTLEGADLATGGVSGVATLPFQLGIDVLDRGISYGEVGRQEGDPGFSMFGGGIPGTKSYKKYTQIGLNNSPSYVARPTPTPQPSQEPLERILSPLEQEML